MDSCGGSKKDEIELEGQDPKGKKYRITAQKQALLSFKEKNAAFLNESIFHVQ